MIFSQCHASASLQPSLARLHWQMHYLLMEAIELQGFCYAISNHLVCQIIFDVNVAFGLLIDNVEVLDVQMTRALAS